jgi:hypothetical protein
MKNAPKAQDADEKPYQPTQADAHAFEAYLAARKKAAPRLKVAPGAKGADAASSSLTFDDVSFGAIRRAAMFEFNSKFLSKFK